MSTLRERARAPFTGLRGRMVLALVVTSLATLAAAALVVLPPLERRVVADRLTELRGLAFTIRPALAALPERDRRRGSPALEQLIEQLQRRTGGRIVVYSSASAELADTETTEAAEPALGPPASLREGALRRRSGVVAGRRGEFAFAATVVGKEPNRLTLVISKRLADSRAAASVMRAALPLALAAGLLVAILLALLLSRSLMRRLGRLRADAEALGADGLEHPIAVTGGDEVTVVARALEGMRERLLDEQASRQEFLSTASHELRTPLASLQATLELLKEEIGRGADDPETTAARMDLALRQTGRLTALATDLLDISRVDGGAPLRDEPVELAELAALIGREFGARLRTDGRTLKIDGGPALAAADPVATARILRVVLDNAAHYGAGTVTIAITPEPGKVRLEVRDEGPGIGEEEREHVFHRFARGQAGTGGPGGAGLGLAIARGLARAMGGELTAEPSSSGGRLVLVLPAA
ncbi:HAMP domain-containing histidine kinase [Solirubrobacter ginsenosidimutans]|uniref:histidine kinase n=1 Tax=Solirubrobacter ginsenosidimutans TaxID=490573 RepID=A0A9X3MSP2_9ACTN|nr:HAMP domain-containing sensor histidine kinase [Solirubrobacter ginsenosidimutans]MDA0161682.1 HAMP domain-containing histidine kinase [Solirubrobacter ginsenosidimutans]